MKRTSTGTVAAMVTGFYLFFFSLSFVAWASDAKPPCGGCGACPSCNWQQDINPNLTLPAGAAKPVLAGVQSNPQAFSLANQVVLLDFDSGVDGNINYTTAIRNAIQSQMEGHFQKFGVTFTQTAPTIGPFSTIAFNSGGIGGVAEQIDFRNLDLSDNALVNVDGIATGTPQSIIDSSANIGSHELGHLLGLRHGDAFGPIGTGISPTGPGATLYRPDYPGPANAVESINHIMGSPGSIGIGIESGDAWFSERAAVKLAFAGNGVVTSELPGANNTLADAQPITLENLIVPNTIVTGVNAGLGDFSVDALVVEGQLETAGDVDLYEFQAETGDLLNVEVISSVVGQRIANTIDPMIAVLNSNGNPISYFTSVAANDDEFESFDSILIDLTIPATGTYYFQVEAFSSSDTGGYELFAQRFNGAIVPEPTTILTLCLAGGVGLLARRRS